MRQFEQYLVALFAQQAHVGNVDYVTAVAAYQVRRYEVVFKVFHRVVENESVLLSLSQVVYVAIVVGRLYINNVRATGRERELAAAVVEVDGGGRVGLDVCGALLAENAAKSRYLTALVVYDVEQHGKQARYE